MTPANHLRAARIFRELADVHYIDAQLASERGDSIAASEEISGHEFALRAATHHEAAAERVTNTNATGCDCHPGGTCPECRARAEPEIEGLTNGPVHVMPAATPGITASRDDESGDSATY